MASKAEVAFAQSFLTWFFTYPLGQFSGEHISEKAGVHPDASRLFSGKKKHNTAFCLSAAMQLHPVEDNCDELDLGSELLRRGHLRGWLRVATLAGRVRTLDLVRWCGNFLRDAVEISSFVLSCAGSAMIGEATTELSLLKPTKPEVFNSMLSFIFGEREWNELEAAVALKYNDPTDAPFDLSCVINLLAQLHLVGEFVVNNILQFWQRLAPAQFRLLLSSSPSLCLRHIQRLGGFLHGLPNQMLDVDKHSPVHSHRLPW